MRLRIAGVVEVQALAVVREAISEYARQSSSGISRFAAGEEPNAIPPVARRPVFFCLPCPLLRNDF